MGRAPAVRRTNAANVGSRIKIVSPVAAPPALKVTKAGTLNVCTAPVAPGAVDGIGPMILIRDGFLNVRSGEISSWNSSAPVWLWKLNATGAVKLMLDDRSNGVFTIGGFSGVT